ncbi:uncharacterized protein N7477_008603 [Penicillium maclennaniae]|uniref:uncharacterized protein n=1 Tax=Penicillium maclennaniae TaxID=1343394 RepID=UPI002541F87E|nr:uncharacterized protein N7477_008603 [Penicillium maclennaniae]KAJ5666155.1 hypothetical protein N7477_008603 [Penicillium maclennaniae]
MSEMKSAVARQPLIAAKFLWLAVNDCFSTGCDGSFVLSKDYRRDVNEFGHAVSVIRAIKTRLDAACPGVVSVADTIAGASNWNRTNIDPDLARTLEADARAGHQSPLDVTTPHKFDNYYYKNLVRRKRVMSCDQELFNGGSTDAIVRRYSVNPGAWSRDFGNAFPTIHEPAHFEGSNSEQN